MLLQDFEYWHPIHARRLHGYALHPLLDHPLGHLLQICRETSETPHRFWVLLGVDRHPMLAAADIDSAASGCTISSAFQSTGLGTDPFPCLVDFFLRILSP